MSRIGNKPIAIPAGVEVTVNGQVVTCKGPKGTLTTTLHPFVGCKVENNEIHVTRQSEDRLHKAQHGTARANVQNMVKGVSTGFEKNLEIVGVGYRAELKGNTLVVYAGYSHTCDFPVPAGLQVSCPDANNIKIGGIDKQLVGEFAANVRKVRKPEPYKGKGIHYVGEYIRRKEGKKAK